MHAGGVAEFEADEEGDCFDGEEAAVDVVTWVGRRSGLVLFFEECVGACCLG